MIHAIVGATALAGLVMAAPTSTDTARAQVPAGSVAGPTTGPMASPTTLTERNRAIVTDFADLFYTQRKPRAAMMKHVAPGYIQHNPQAADGRDAAIGMLEPLFGAPGASFTVKRIIVDGDLAVIHILGRPDPRGPGVVAIDIYRLKDGKIVEHWDAIQPITPSTVNPHPFF